jgi:hypothetical protein
MEAADDSCTDVINVQSNLSCFCQTNPFLSTFRLFKYRQLYVANTFRELCSHKDISTPVNTSHLTVARYGVFRQWMLSQLIAKENIILLLLLLLLLLLSVPPLCRVSTLISLKQTMSVDNNVLQLF